jgi:2-polyprenyl-3-methyl-5-hydroxy-6-metoxy-1,4-benzoquinol methylase
MTITLNTRACWCGNADLLPFGAGYGECRACRTLVYLKDMPPEQLLVRDDDTDFYGKKYWLEHQQDAFGNADIFTRARNDLTERNLYWLKTLLKYRLPPSKVLELGCSHGSFVALLRQAGYDATGAEMSSWVVEFGQKTFGIPIAVGPVEVLDIPPGSLDIIVLMDVLEHLSDPVSTMAHCLKLLKPAGLLLIQTPQFKEEMNYTTLVETNARFLEMLIPGEHIYLFSDHSVTRLFQQLGAAHIQFEPAIFDHYDMFFAVKRIPIQTNTPEQVESALLSKPNGRLTLALLELRERELKLTQQCQESWTYIQTLTSIQQELQADLKALFARSGFRWLTRFSRWPELDKLKSQIGTPDE